MNIELKESNKFQEFPTTKTDRVLEKWSNEGNSQSENIKKAASEYARYEVNNKILKWIIAVVVIFLFVLLGFMIASVVLGVHITKEVSVKNGQLVSSEGNNTVVKTSNLKYHSQIHLNSPTSVIDSLTSITVNINDGMYQGVLQFDVVSYEFTPGKKLTFYGHSHSADVMPDGTVKLNSLLPYSSSKRDDTESTGTSVSGTSTSTGSSNVVSIDTCNDFYNIQETGFYKLSTSLSCALNLPLLAGKVFNGNFDGNGKVLTLTSSSNGPIAFFETLGGSVSRFEIDGTLQGVGNCASFAITALGGAYVSKAATHAKITCTSSSTGSKSAGGFFAKVQPSTDVGSKVTIIGSVSQASITYQDSGAYLGGFVGSTFADHSITTLTNCATDPNFDSNGHTDIFGFADSNYTPECQQENNYCLVNVGQTNQELSCCLPIERTPNNPSSNNCDSLFCYKGRDISPRNSAKRAQMQLKDTTSNTITNANVSPFYETDVCY